MDLIILLNALVLAVTNIFFRKVAEVTEPLTSIDPRDLQSILYNDDERSGLPFPSEIISFIIYIVQVQVTL